MLSLKHWFTFALLAGTLSAAAIEGALLPTVGQNLTDVFTRVMPGRPPLLVGITEVFPEQPFELYLLVGKPGLVDGKAEVVADLSMKTPAGGTMVLAKDLAVYAGAAAEGAVVLSDKRLRIEMTKGDPAGEYELIAELKDRTNGASAHLSRKLTLLPQVPRGVEAVEGDPLQFLRRYYLEPRPGKVLGMLKNFYEMLPELRAKNANYTPLPMLYGFIQVLKLNPELWVPLADWANSLEREDSFCTLLIIDNLGEAAQEKMRPWLGHEKALAMEQLRKGMFDFTEVTHPLQVDFLWMEFFATGRYEPIFRIASLQERLANAFTVEEFNQKKDSKTLTPEEKDKLGNFLIGTAAGRSLNLFADEHLLVPFYLEWALANKKLPGQISNTLTYKVLERVSAETAKRRAAAEEKK